MVNNPKLGEFKEDKLNDHLKCDKCDYIGKKSNFMIKRMNTNHCNYHVEKDHNSDKRRIRQMKNQIKSQAKIKTSKILKEKSV